jgi:RNA polymerase sigma factor (sigma-70 family)
VTEPDVARMLDAVWRTEFTRIVAVLTRQVRDVGLAEQIAQDAFVAALEQWRATGVPDQPGAWLLAAARNRAVDHVRRGQVQRRRAGELAAAPPREVPDPAVLAEDEIGDDVLRLMFLCCHPVLAHEARTALTLRLLGGLSADEIARAYLVPEATVAQRIVRGKRTLAEQEVEFELPAAGQRRERLQSVLEVLYLVFNEGYAGTAGADWTRPELCEEAMRLSRVLASLAPDEPEVHGLLALMELQASRLAARRGADGDAVLLLDQDRSQWDQAAIQRGLSALERAAGLRRPAGGYELQAAIAACHARAATAAETDWQRIVQLYGQLLAVAPSPVVELNRAVAVAMAFGPLAGLVLVQQLAGDESLRDYHLLPSVRGDLLSRLGRHREAQAEFERAAALAKNDRERAVLAGRAAASARAASAP